METVTIDTLRDDAAVLAAEAKGLDRRARSLKQQAAAHRDRIHQFVLQSKEDTSESEHPHPNE